jgi:F-type H+-transporting ATPase subunit delta
MARASGSARRYAQAVFDIARDQGAFDAWRDDLQALTDVLGIKEVQEFLDAPQIADESKQQILDQHLGRLGEGARNLASLLINKRRVHLIKGIYQTYEEMLDEHRGVVSATVTTAVPLDSALQKQVEETLRRQTGRELRLSTTVDPTILGGLVARVGDKVIDGSTRSRLRNLRDWLREEAAT